MIKYALKCGCDHEFDVWFSSISDYDAQAAQGLVSCPLCGCKSVEKAIMAPNVTTARKKDAAQTERAKAAAAMNVAAAKIRDKIAAECDYVGEKFADEALAMHYGERSARAIYGTATADQARDLAEHGVGAAPLPDILVPKPNKERDKKLN